MAKTIINSSIKIHGIGKPNAQTIFTIKEEAERSLPNFVNLTRISKRTLEISFTYKENDAFNTSSFFVTIPNSDDENSIENFILEQINNHLAD